MRNTTIILCLLAYLHACSFVYARYPNGDENFRNAPRSIRRSDNSVSDSEGRDTGFPEDMKELLETHTAILQELVFGQATLQEQNVKLMKRYRSLKKYLRKLNRSCFCHSRKTSNVVLPIDSGGRETAPNPRGFSPDGEASSLTKKEPITPSQHSNPKEDRLDPTEATGNADERLMYVKETYKQPDARNSQAITSSLSSQIDREDSPLLTTTESTRPQSGRYIRNKSIFLHSDDKANGSGKFSTPSNNVKSSSAEHSFTNSFSDLPVTEPIDGQVNMDVAQNTQNNFQVTNSVLYHVGGEHVSTESTFTDIASYLSGKQTTTVESFLPTDDHADTNGIIRSQSTTVGTNAISGLGGRYTTSLKYVMRSKGSTDMNSKITSHVTGGVAELDGKDANAWKVIDNTIDRGGFTVTSGNNLEPRNGAYKLNGELSYIFDGKLDSTAGATKTPPTSIDIQDYTNNVSDKVKTYLTHVTTSKPHPFTALGSRVSPATSDNMISSASDNLPTSDQNYIFYSKEFVGNRKVGRNTDTSENNKDLVYERKPKNKEAKNSQTSVDAFVEKEKALSENVAENIDIGLENNNAENIVAVLNKYPTVSSSAKGLRNPRENSKSAVDKIEIPKSNLESNRDTIHSDGNMNKLKVKLHDLKLTNDRNDTRGVKLKGVTPFPNNSKVEKANSHKHGIDSNITRENHDINNEDENDEMNILRNEGGSETINSESVPTGALENVELIQLGHTTTNTAREETDKNDKQKNNDRNAKNFGGLKKPVNTPGGRDIHTADTLVTNSDSAAQLNRDLDSNVGNTNGVTVSNREINTEFDRDFINARLLDTMTNRDVTKEVETEMNMKITNTYTIQREMNEKLANENNGGMFENRAVIKGFESEKGKNRELNTGFKPGKDVHRKANSERDLGFESEVERDFNDKFKDVTETNREVNENEPTLDNEINDLATTDESVKHSVQNNHKSDGLNILGEGNGGVRWDYRDSLSRRGGIYDVNGGDSNPLNERNRQLGVEDNEKSLGASLLERLEMETRLKDSLNNIRGGSTTEIPANRGFYDLEIDLTSGQYHGNHFAISWISNLTRGMAERCSFQGVVQLTFPRALANEIQETIMIDMWFDQPTSWVFNIGDSSSNDGFSGDGGTQQNDCEAEGYGTTFTIHGSDKTTDPLNKLLRMENDFLNKTASFLVSNEEMAWRGQGQSDYRFLRSDGLFALKGQSDSQGPVNYDVYVGMNRVIAGNYRHGHGLCWIGFKWLSLINT